MNSKNRIAQLDGLRIFMCLTIVITHFEFLSFTSVGEFYMTYVKHSVLAVDYFFILSGFGIYYSSYNKDLNCSLKDSIKFAIKKIYKIYPIYVISCLIGMFEWLPTSFFGAHSFSAVVRIFKVILSFVFCPFLVQSLTGSYPLVHAMNGVCWFLSSLFISYIFCPIFIKIVNRLKNKRNTFSFLIGVLVVIVVLNSISTKVDSMMLFGVIDNISGVHPFIRCFYLLMGMCVSKIVMSDRSKNISSFKVFFFFMFYILYFFSRNVIVSKISELNFSVEIINIIDIVFTSLLIYICSCGKGKIIDFLSNKKIVYYSNYCMYVYLLHFPIRMVLLKVGEITNFFKLGEWTFVVLILLILLFTYILTWLCSKYKDKIDEIINPFIDHFYRLFDKK